MALSNPIRFFTSTGTHKAEASSSMGGTETKNFEILESPSNDEKQIAGGDGIIYFKGNKFIQGITATQAKYVNDEIDKKAWNGGQSFSISPNNVNRYTFKSANKTSETITATGKITGTNLTVTGTPTIKQGNNGLDVTGSNPYTATYSLTTLTNTSFTFDATGVKITTQADPNFGVSTEHAGSTSSATVYIYDPVLHFTSASETLAAGTNVFELNTQDAGKIVSNAKTSWTWTTTNEEYLYILVPASSVTGVTTIGTTTVGSKVWGLTSTGAQDTCFQIYQDVLTSSISDIKYYVYRSQGKIAAKTTKTLKFA